MRQAWSEDKQKFFAQSFLGQKIDLEQFSKPFGQAVLVKSSSRYTTFSVKSRLNQCLPGIISKILPNGFAQYCLLKALITLLSRIFLTALRNFGVLNV